MTDYKEKIEIIRSKAEYEFIREMAYREIVNDTKRHLEAVQRNEIIMAQNKKLKMRKIIISISLILMVILLNLIFSDLIAKILAFALVFAMVFLVPFTICLLLEI